jgi:hypothetical protein
MSKKRRLVSEPQGDLFAAFGQNIRLIFRLMADARVSPLLKLLPAASLLYLISPLDVAIPLLDDALILWVGNSLFIELCPPGIVQEHRAALEPAGKPPQGEAIDEAEIIEAEYTTNDKAH